MIQGPFLRLQLLLLRTARPSLLARSSTRKSGEGMSYLYSERIYPSSRTFDTSILTSTKPFRRSSIRTVLKGGAESETNRNGIHYKIPGIGEGLR